MEEVFVDEENEEEDRIIQQQQQQQQHSKSYNHQKLDDVKKEEMIRKLCYLCERAKCTYFCRDVCKRAFHKECRKKVEAGDINVDGPTEKIDIEENNMEDEAVKAQMNHNYRCLDCQNQEVVCYLCKHKGKYYGAEYHKKKDTKASVLRLVKKP